MEHHHHHDCPSHHANRRALTLSLLIIVAYMVVEVIGGWLTHSLALLADAGHMLSDAISLFIALMAFKFSRRRADYRRTYGYKRFEILAAVINGTTLIFVAGYIFYEAIERFQNPPQIASFGMLLVSVVGLLVNVLVAWIMLRGTDVKDNLNMRGAYLHVISDMLGSVGAILAALFIMLWGWSWADPLASVIVALLVLRSGYRVTKASLHVLMEGTPDNVDVEKVTAVILDTKGIVRLHDLHIWSITSGLNALTCHAVVAEEMTIFESGLLLRQIEHELSHLNIHHVTIQLEPSSHSHDDSLLCSAQAEGAADAHHHHHH